MWLQLEFHSPSNVHQVKFLSAPQLVDPFFFLNLAVSTATISLFAKQEHGIPQADHFAKMSSNVSVPDQAQAVAPTSAPGFSHPSSHLSVLLPNDDELQGDVQQAPAFLDPIHIPIPNKPSEELIKSLAKLIAEKGPAVGALYAYQYHKSLNQANAPTVDELLLRVLDTRANLDQERYAKYHQGSPNAMALRFLAPNAGQRYPFVKFNT